MLLILPPSETKRDGGAEGSKLDLSRLSFPELTAPRKQALTALRALSRNLGAAAGALRLGGTQRFEINRNRTVTTSPTMAALDRYTGVLYEALDGPGLEGPSRAFAEEHFLVHSALFGLLRGADPIPAYRLSHDSRLPGISLGRHWRGPLSAVLASQSGLMLDLRSESYSALGPAPASAYYLRVISEEGDRRSVLTHFNKSAKGSFARAIAEAGIDHPDVESLIAWATASGLTLRHGVAGELDLVV